MQVSSFDTVPLSANEKEAVKPAAAASDAFAVLLQSAFQPQTNPGLLRLAEGSELAKQISEGREFFSDTQPAEDFALEEPAELPDEPAPRPEEKPVDEARSDEDADSPRPADPLPLFGETRSALNIASNSGAAVSQRVGAVGQQSSAAQSVANDASAASIAQNTLDSAGKTANGSPLQNGNAEGRITANVSDAGQQMVSRPANTLAAAATLAAQTSKPGSAADASIGNNAQGTGGTTGNLLLSDAGGRSMYQGNGQRGASQGTPTTIANTPDIATNTATSNTSFTASMAAAQTPLPAPTPRPVAGTERAAGTLALESGALTSQTTANGGAARPANPVPPARTPIPASALREQISVQVQRAVGQGIDRINIQLKPAELGRLEIKLDVAQDGKVTAMVTVERPETLELLQKDARGLQQTLQDAGLKTDSNGLSFNLRGGDTAPQEQTANGGNSADQKDADAANSDELAESQDESTRRRASDSLIDVEV